jgi:uncharacterized protein YwgA
MNITKQEWIILLLRKAPLDRIRIMKSLFLIWLRSNKNIQDYYHFEPYLYGPCSFEVYSELRNLLAHGLVTQSPHPIQQWAKYYLTEEGHAASERAVKNTTTNTAALIAKTAEEVSRLGFSELLRQVYQEAPEFAVNSLLKGVIKR